ncbi:MAG: T9SS type A sorting domain-containing protein [Bacteroidales bacterium]|nr:T9SS type A sorting domain-containing protein [Bacteroidales bacterium]
MKTLLLIITAICLPGIILAQGIKIGTNMIMTGETVMYVDGAVDIDNDGDLKIESGSSLILSDGNTLTVNDGGKLTLMGEDGNPVTVTSAGYFVFIVSSGGTIGAEYATFEKMSGDGLNIQSGATIDPALPLNNSIFQSGASSSTFLTINNSQELTIAGVAFISTPGNELYNVAKTLNIGEVTFTNFSGNFAGEAYENDPFNRIHWSDVPLNRLVENVTLTNGQELCFDAVQTITVQDLLVQSGGVIHLVAGQSVLLLPGILVEANGYLRAWIDTDGMYCMNAKAIIAVADQPIPEIKFEEAMPLSAGIRVFPNPTTGSFTLELPEAVEDSRANVEIYGMMGELVQQTTLIGERSYQFNLSDKPRGIYIVRVLQGESLYMEKVIRQ